MKKFFTVAVTALALISCNDKKSDATVESDTATTAVVVDSASMVAPELPMDSAAMMAAWEAYSTPGEMHQMFAKSNGTWKEELKFYMTPGADPVTYNATCENTTILNGLYQRSVHKGQVMGKPFEGQSTLGYNNASKKFESTWIDNMSTGILFMSGDMDAATKTISTSGQQTDPMTGNTITVRETYKVIDDNNHYMEMFETHGGKERKTMEVKFTKM